MPEAQRSPTRREVSFDVPSDLWPGGIATVCGTVLADLDALAGCDNVTLVVAAPGGTYTRAYWNLEVPGRVDWSAAAHLANAGYVVFRVRPTEHRGVEHCQ